LLKLDSSGYITFSSSVQKQTIHSPSDAACSKQLPSPVVANGSSRWQMPISAHQFNRPKVKRTLSQPC